MANKQYTVEDIAKIRKGMTEARQKRSEEIAKQTNAAPKYNSLPTLDDTSKRVPTQAPSSMNIGSKTFKVADNARNTTLSKNNGNAVRPSTKYNNQTAELSKPQPKRDAKFDKDFDDFYEWRYNRADTTDYDANTDTSVPHWESVKRDIMKKNNWSEADFDKRWKEYDKMRTQKMADEEVKTAADLSNSYPLLGAVVQQAFLPQTIIEGVETYLDNALGLLRPDLVPSSSDDPRFTGTRVREASKQALRDNSKTKVGAVAKDIVGELADLGMNAAMSGGNPLLMGLFTGAQSATRNQMEALERGADSKKAALYGSGAGAISGVMNAIGLDKALGASAKTVLGTIGKSAATEALENVVEDSANLGLDELINKDYSQLQTLHDYYVGQNLSDTEAWAQVAKDTGIDLLKSAGSGALFGGFISGVKNGAPVALEKGAGKILDWKAKRDSKKANDLADKLLAETSDDITSNNVNDTNMLNDESFNNGYKGVPVEYDDEEYLEPEKLEHVLTGEKVSQEYASFVRKLESGQVEDISSLKEEYNNIPEIKEAKSRAGKGDTSRIMSPERAALRDDILKKINNYGSAEQYYDPIDKKIKVGYSGVVDRGHRADIIIGLPSSGKSTALVDPISQKYHSKLLDSDEVKKLIPEYKKGWGAGLVHEESKQILDLAKENAYKNGDNIVLPIVGSNVDKVRKQIELLKDVYGYEVHLHLNDLDSTKAAARNMRRFASKGRFLDLDATSFDYGDKPREVYEQLKKEGVANGYNKVSNDVRIGENPVQLEGTEVIPFDWRNNRKSGRSFVGENEIGGDKALNGTGEDSTGDTADNEQIQLENQEKQPTSEVASSMPENTPHYMGENAGLERVNDDNSMTYESEPIQTEGFNREGEARFMTNEAITAGIFTKEYYEKNKTLQDIAKIAKTSESESMAHAMETVDTPEKTEEWFNKVTKGEYQLGSDANKANSDFDTGMIVLQGLADELDMATTNAEKRAIVIRRNALLRKMKDFSHNMAIGLQAHAKWTNTADGAIMAGERLLGEQEAYWKGRNKSKVEGNKKIAEALEKIGNDGTIQRAERTPLTHEEIKQGVKAEIEKEFGAIAQKFGDTQLEYLTSLVENRVSTDVIADEIEHFLNHGEFYEITEDAPEKLPKMGALSNMLDRIAGVEKQKAEKTPDTLEQIVQKVRNTFADDSSSFAGNFDDNDYIFIGTMFKEGVPKWQIEDEIRYKLENGTWYSLDESIESPKSKSQRLRNALNSIMGEETAPTEKAVPTYDELREQVRNTLEDEYAGIIDVTDEDVNYIAGMLSQGATKQEIADALNTKMATGTFGVSAETQAEVNRLFKAMDMVNSESEDYAKLQAEAFRLIANETKSHASPLEKFDAWRYLAMLGNPKTMVRNWVGNQLFNVVTGISNNIAALGEELADRRHFKKTGEHIERTKAFINPFSKEGRAEYNRAKRDFNLTRYVSGAGTKYKDTKSAIEDASSVFDSKLVQLYEQLTDAGISDTSAVRRKYATSLMGYMKANGLTEADMDASYKYDELNRQSRRRLLSKTEQAELEQAREKHQMMEKARDYALKEAEYATFHEDNAFAEALTKAANSSDIAKIFIDGMVPFKKTPANVLKSGLEYSPLGITKSGYLTIKHAIESKGDYADTYARKKLIGKGEKEVTKTTVNDVIDSWSKSLTGTGLALLGYMLYSKGVLQSSNKDEKYQDQLEGLQNFSIKLNIGGKDHTYTIDWAAPAVMPLLMGAEVKKVMEDRAVAGEKITPDDVIEIINSTINPIMETSMLQGVQNTLETVARQAGNSNGAAEFAGGVLGSLATNLATGYVTQAIPTVSGQLARTLDGTRRSTDTKSTSAFGSEAEKQMRKTMNKIPFLSRLNTPYLDAYGREQSNSPFEYSDRFTDEPVKNIAKGVGNLVYQSTSPGYLQKVNQTDSDKIRREAYNSLDESGKPIKEADVYAPWKSTVKMNGKKFTPEQMYTYRAKSGNASEEIGNALAKEDWYNDLSGKAQTELLKSTRSLVDNIGKAAVNKGFAPESSKAFEAYESGGIPSLMEYYKEEAHKDAVKAELGSTSEFATELYDSGDRSRMNKYRAAVDIASQYGKDTITEEQFLKYEKYGKQALEKDLEYANVAKELDVSNNKTFKSLVDKEVPEEQIKKAYDAITSVQIGEDEFGRPKYMSFNEDNYNIYRNYGEKGLEDYQYIESRGADFDTYLQAKRVLSLDKKEYVAKFNAIDGKADSKANGSISQKELLKLFNDKGFSESQANKYWQAFGKVSGDDAWKSVPVLKYNKKTGRTEWTTQKKK